jgi:hypothetical protein
MNGPSATVVTTSTAAGSARTVGTDDDYDVELCSSIGSSAWAVSWDSSSGRIHAITQYPTHSFTTTLHTSTTIQLVFCFQTSYPIIKHQHTQNLHQYGVVPNEVNVPYVQQIKFKFNNITGTMVPGPING